jgi:hypothetical protein
MPAKATKTAKKATSAARVKDLKPKADATGGTEKVGHGRRRFKIRDTGG